MNLAQEISIQLPPMKWVLYKHICRLKKLNNGLFTLKIEAERKPTGESNPAEGTLENLTREAKLSNLKATIFKKRQLAANNDYLPTIIILKYLES